jgi:hypothetical protein
MRGFLSHSVIRRAVAIPITLAIVAVSASGVMAAKPIRELSPSPPEFDLDGFCAYPVHVDMLADKGATITYVGRDGQPTYTRVNGHLVTQVTNATTGASEVLNISGPGTFRPIENGMTRVDGTGNWLIYLSAADAGGPGIWWTHGRLSIVIDEEGTVVKTALPASRIDVCALLSS